MLKPLCLFIAVSLPACTPTEKDGEDTSARPEYEIPCVSWATQESRGVLEIEIEQIESVFPDLGPCCDTWDGVWTAEITGGQTGHIYLSPIEYDEWAGVLRSSFEGGVEDCALTLWNI